MMTSKKMENNPNKNNGRQPNKKIKIGRQPQKKWKMTYKKNTGGRPTKIEDDL